VCLLFDSTGGAAAQTARRAPGKERASDSERQERESTAESE